MNFELKFFESFFTFSINWITNFQIESNEFRTNPISDNLTLSSSWSWIKRIEFKSILVKFFGYFLPFRINRIIIFRSEQILIWLHPSYLCELSIFPNQHVQIFAISSLGHTVRLNKYQTSTTKTNFLLTLHLLKVVLLYSNLVI